MFRLPHFFKPWLKSAFEAIVDPPVTLADDGCIPMDPYEETFTVLSVDWREWRGSNP
jgi:hypothetical protein